MIETKHSSAEYHREDTFLKLVFRSYLTSFRESNTLINIGSCCWPQNILHSFNFEIVRCHWISFYLYFA